VKHRLMIDFELAQLLRLATRSWWQCPTSAH
jgi:hypothetical protein